MNLDHNTSFRRRLYWVVVSYLRHDSLWVYMGLYVIIIALNWCVPFLTDGSNRKDAVVPEADLVWTSDHELLHEHRDQEWDAARLLKEITAGNLPNDVEGFEVGYTLVRSGLVTRQHVAALAQYRNLRGLRFETIPPDLDIFGSIADVRQLEFLEIEVASIDSDAIEALASLPRLIHLRLNDCKLPQSLRGLERAPRLQTLIIDRDRFRPRGEPNRHAVQAVHIEIPVLPQVRRLAIDGNALATQDGMQVRWPEERDIGTLRQYPNLRQLFVYDNGSLGIPVDEIQRSLPEVFVFSCLVPDGRGFITFLLTFPMALLLYILWLQLHAQTASTQSPLVPRFWLPHQLAFAAVILVAGIQQILYLLWWEVDVLAAIALTTLPFGCWVVVRYLYRIFDSPARRRKRTIGFSVRHGLQVLGVIGVYYVIFYFARRMFDSTAYEMFLSGAFPAASVGATAASLVSIAYLIGGMPLQFRRLYESTSRLPPIEFSQSAWQQWGIESSEPATPQTKSSSTFADLYPGCVAHNDSRRAALVRQANLISGFKFLYMGIFLVALMSLQFVLALFGMGAVNDVPRLASRSWPMMWFATSMMSLMIVTQWEQRRRLMPLELMRPVTRSMMFRDFAQAIVGDSFPLYLLQFAVIIVYAATSGGLTVSLSATILLVATWCLVPCFGLVVVTFRHSWQVFLFIAVNIPLFVAAQYVLLNTQAARDPNGLAWLLELVTVIVACGWVIILTKLAKSRWRNLEWDA
ncbi:MAG: hypothetical protein WD065_14560 [Planctomycetaceae bacterium]